MDTKLFELVQCIRIKCLMSSARALEGHMHSKGVRSTCLLGSSLSSKGAANATMIGDRNCRTTESERGISCREVYSRKMEAKLHRPRTTSMVCLHKVISISTEHMRISRHSVTPDCNQVAKIHCSRLHMCKDELSVFLRTATTCLVPNGLSGLQYMRGNTAPTRMAKLRKTTMTAVPRPSSPEQIQILQFLAMFDERRGHMLSGTLTQQLS